MPGPVYQTSISSLPLLHRGKVRDIYAIDARHMLVVTTDRISAFDVVMPSPVPDKGALLTKVSNFWFDRFKHLIASQASSLRLDELNLTAAEFKQVAGRCVIVKRLRALPLEAIVRGYLIGSAWQEYRQKQSVCGIALPENSPLAGKLTQTIYTPSTKAAAGRHDENISFQETVALVGEQIAEQVRAMSIALYENAADYALERGIVIADTKFEFGLDDGGTLTLIDEVLTPDSSRFWPADEYTPGRNPDSFDKQYIRDYLETLAWNKQAPAPELPAEVIRNTQLKYAEAARRLLQEKPGTPDNAY